MYKGTEYKNSLHLSKRVSYQFLCLQYRSMWTKWAKETYLVTFVMKNLKILNFQKISPKELVQAIPKLSFIFNAKPTRISLTILPHF